MTSFWGHQDNPFPPYDDEPIGTDADGVPYYEGDERGIKMTCERMRTAFEDNAPDKYQKHFQAMQQIIHDRSTPDFIKYQQMRDLTLSAETGMSQSMRRFEYMEV